MSKEALAHLDNFYPQKPKFNLARITPFRKANPDNQIKPTEAKNRPSDRLEELSEREKRQLLVHTGFDLPKQVVRLVKDIKVGLDQGLNPDQALAQAQAQGRLDIISFYQEYLNEAPLLVANHKVVEDRVEPNGYPGFSITDFILRADRDGVEERDGAVLFANREIEKAQVRAFKAKQRLTSVIVSPPGPNGIINPLTKQELNHYEFSQVVIWELQSDGQVVSNTIVSDFNQRQCRELIMALGGKVNFIDKSQTERELVANMVKAVVIKPETDLGQTLTTREILDKMAQISHTPLVNRVRGQTFRQVRADLDRRDELFNLDDKCQDELTKFEQVQAEKVDQLIQAIQNLEIKDIDKLTSADFTQLFRRSPELRAYTYELRDLILKMSAILRGKVDITTGQPMVDLEEEIEVVGSKVGCNGGGVMKKNRAQTMPEHYQSGACAKCGKAGKVGVCTRMCEECEDKLGVYDEKPLANLLVFPGQSNKKDQDNRLRLAA